MRVLAPIMIAAGCYIVFGRLLESVLPGGHNAKKLGVRAQWVTVTFIASDVFSFALEGAGQLSSLRPRAARRSKTTTN